MTDPVRLDRRRFAGSASIKYPVDPGEANDRSVSSAAHLGRATGRAARRGLATGVASLVSGAGDVGRVRADEVG